MKIETIKNSARPYEVEDTLIRLIALLKKEVLNDLFADCDRLIWHFVRSFRHFVPPEALMDDDDIYQEIAISFIKALRNFDHKRRIKFITYFAHIAKTDLLVIRRKYNGNKRKIYKFTTSLDKVVYNKDRGEVRLMDLLVDEEDLEQRYISENFLYDCIDKLDKEERELLEQVINDLSQSVIAKGMGISQAYLSKKLKKIRKRLREIMEFGIMVEEKERSKRKRDRKKDKYKKYKEILRVMGNFNELPNKEIRKAFLEEGLPPLNSWQLNYVKSSIRKELYKVKKEQEYQKFVEEMEELETREVVL